MAMCRWRKTARSKLLSDDLRSGNYHKARMLLAIWELMDCLAVFPSESSH